MVIWSVVLLFSVDVFAAINTRPLDRHNGCEQKFVDIRYFVEANIKVNLTVIGLNSTCMLHKNDKTFLYILASTQALKKPV